MTVSTQAILLRHHPDGAAYPFVRYLSPGEVRPDVVQADQGCGPGALPEQLRRGGCPHQRLGLVGVEWKELEGCDAVETSYLWYP